MQPMRSTKRDKLGAAEKKQGPPSRTLPGVQSLQSLLTPQMPVWSYLAPVPNTPRRPAIPQIGSANASKEHHLQKTQIAPALQPGEATHPETRQQSSHQQAEGERPGSQQNPRTCRPRSQTPPADQRQRQISRRPKRLALRGMCEMAPANFALWGVQHVQVLCMCTVHQLRQAHPEEHCFTH